MGKPETSIIWKMSDRRAKHRVKCEWVVVEHICGTFGLAAFKAILRSFGALTIFLKIRFSKRCFFYTSDPAFSAIRFYKGFFSQSI